MTAARIPHANMADARKACMHSAGRTKSWSARLPREAHFPFGIQTLKWESAGWKTVSFEEACCCRPTAAHEPCSCTAL